METATATTDGEATASRLTRLMLGVFLGGGLLASVEALLVPRLRLVFDFDYARALLVQLAYYAGYLVFAVPAAALTSRLGSMRATAIGLTMMAAGCAALAAALSAGLFGPLLFSLLLLSVGVTILQIAGNGIVATLGDRRRAAARFTVLQGFNSLGTVAGPLLGAWFLLDGRGTARAIVPFAAFAILFGGLATAFAARRDLAVGDGGGGAPRRWDWRVATMPRVRAGAAAIFAYVGAEVTIATLGVAYLLAPGRLAIGPVAAGRLISLYWLGAMVGRFLGGVAFRRIAPPRALAAVGIAAAACVVGAMLLPGTAGVVALLAIGLCNAIMFPTIYGLAMPPDARDVPVASMVMCMAVVGGAVVPFASGVVADRLGLGAALLLPLACYGTIAAYARGAS